jgi:multicomponent Na+:H+ antiporter subunit D
LLANHPVLVIIIPLICAIVIPLAGRINKDFSWFIAMAGSFLSFVFSIKLVLATISTGRISYRLGGWEPPWGIEYAVDNLNAFVLVIVTFIAFAVAYYARESVLKEIGEEKSTLFYSVYMLFITGLTGVTITGDIFNLYVFIELTSLSVYALIAMGQRRDALIASFNYLILGTIGGTFILLGVGYLYMVTGTLNMADLSRLLPDLYSSSAIRTAFAFFTVGLSLKVALFPLHIWLPRAYSEAPSVVSAVVAATATKVMAYVLIRIMFTVFTVDFDVNVLPVSTILIILSSVAIIMGSVLAVAQTNLKRMLAYSSIGQIGYIVLGVALVNKLAMSGALIHILNHALMKGALFMVAGVLVYTTGVADIKALRGKGKEMPFTMAAFTIAALSMIGVPLTVGFTSKWYLALGALEAEMWYLIPVILVSSLLTAVYFWRIVESIYFAPPKADTVETPIVKAAPSMVIATCVLALLCIFFGVFANIPAFVTELAADSLLDPAPIVEVIGEAWKGGVPH